MKTGFNWELGPFELWDAVGVAETVAKMTAAPENVKRLLDSGAKSWYTEMPGVQSGRGYFDLRTGKYQPVGAPEGVWSVREAKSSHGVVAKNAGASLIDIGDGVGCIEIHGLKQAIGQDTVSFVTKTVKPGSEHVRNFDAFVITADGANFAVGANIMMLLMGIQEGEWDEIDMSVRGFQGMTQAIKFCPKPVVVAPAGMALGGGCEIALHGAARQPYAELYMGLVEVGVGLLPGGGGCKEMVLRAVDTAQSVRPGQRGESVEMMEAMKKTFETIAMAKVSMSAEEARGYGFLSQSDGITMNRERVLTDAKHRALDLARGYAPPVPRTEIPAPGESILATLKLGVHIMRQGEYITEHEVKIATKVAEVICGGAVPPGTAISEQYLLDLEREGFKSLCGEKKTQERIAFTLKTGKPLRN